MRRPESWVERVRGLAANRKGNVAIIFSLAALPLMFSVGMSLDYVTAARKRAKLNAIADASALATVTPTAMAKTATQAQAIGRSLFLAQAGTTDGITFSSSDISISVVDTTTNGLVTRNTTVTYAATSPNTFANLLGRSSLSLAGSAVASTSTAPNIDFYLMLDTSPSMAIAATTAGIATMMKNTPSQDSGAGCAFACHQSNPAADSLGNPGGIDNYQLARNLGVTLRMDLVTQATEDLMDYATTMEADTSATYRAGIYTFDYELSNPVPLTSNLSAAKTKAADIEILTVYKNNYLTSSNNNSDQDTSWTTGITGMQSNLPTPGKGSNNSGDSPQEVLFIVTDGVADESNNGRQIYAEGGTACTTIKNRGIRIAILYTTYNPLPTNAFYKAKVASFQPNIGTTLQSCATSGLYSVVNSGDDISAALQTLFNKAITTAHLTK